MNLFNDNIADDNALSEFRESDWEAMQKLLEEKEDSKKPFYFWWIGSSFLLAIFISTFFLFGNKKEQNLIRLNEEKSQLKILLPDLQTLSTKQNINSTDFGSNSMNFPKNITKPKIAFTESKIERIKSEKEQTELNFKNTKLEEKMTQLEFSNAKLEEKNIPFINRINIDSLSIEIAPNIATNKNFIAPPKPKLKRLNYGIYIGTNAEIRATNETKYLPEIGISLEYNLSEHYFLSTRLTYQALFSKAKNTVISYTEAEIDKFNDVLSQEFSVNGVFNPSASDMIQFQYYENNLSHYLNLPLTFGYQKGHHQLSVGVNNRFYLSKYEWKVKEGKTTATNFFAIANEKIPETNYTLSAQLKYGYRIDKNWRVEAQLLRDLYTKNQIAKNWQIGLGVSYMLSQNK